MVIDIPPSRFEQVIAHLHQQGMQVYYADPMALYISFSWGTQDAQASEAQLRAFLTGLDLVVHTLQIALDDPDRMVLLLADLRPQHWFSVQDGTARYRQMAASKEELLSELRHDHPHCGVTLDNITQE